MLRRSELAIIKNGVLTVNNYSFSTVYRMLGMCANPGIYDIIIKNRVRYRYYKSDGNKVWMAKANHDVISETVLYKDDLVKMLDTLVNATSNATRYYEIEEMLYREYENMLYYLTPNAGVEQDLTYSESSIPMSVIFKILRPDFPSKSSRDSLIFSGRLDSIKRTEVTKDYLDQYSTYLGYTKVEDYFVLMTFDDMVRIDTVEDGKFKSLKTTMSSLKEAIIT